ncbi:MAG: thioredoxin domain-containing protein, partial [Clostridia bacterium]|nr:thioredoxin domain-containing protein [Clostridia bacterium]
DIIEKTFRTLERYFDKSYGGFGDAPKFPTPHNLTFLLRYYKVKGDKKALEMVEKSLEQMYKGGIFDHIGYGFSRYSTDDKWLVPHFEKMLYDNALLAIAYLETYQVTKSELYKEVAEKIFEYILRDMTSLDGTFYSGEDADSEGVEGKFYIWSPREVTKVLGIEDGNDFCSLYDVTEKGNFEGGNIPNLIKSNLKELRSDEQKSSKIKELRRKLFEVRENRVHPFKDDKILTGWNGLMIVALAIGGRVLENSQYLSAAEKAMEFILLKLINKEGRLLARYREGEAAYLAYLDDYAFLVWGLIELYETTYKPEYLEKALNFNKEMMLYFWDEDKGGFYLTGEDSEELLTRSKEIYDGAIPSGNSVAALNLLRLADLSGDYELEEKAQQLFYYFGGEVEDNSIGYTFFLQAYLYSQVATREVVVVNKEGSADSGEMLNTLRKNFLPYTISFYLSSETKDITTVVPFLSDYKVEEGKTVAYICQNRACQPPINDLNKFNAALIASAGIEVLTR